MITRFTIANFKNLRMVSDLKFEPVNVLIGPNGSGKSSLLQAIDFLRGFFMSSVEVYLQERGWEYSDLPNLRESHPKIRWDFEAILPKNANGQAGGTYHYSISLSPRRYLGVGEESLSCRRNGEGSATVLLERKGRSVKWLNRKTGRMEEFREIGLPASVMSRLERSRDQERFPELLHFRSWVDGFRGFLLWDPKVLRMPDRGKHDTLGPSGEHLAPLLGRLKRERPESYSRLIDRVKRLFPTVSEISVAGGRTWGWQSLRLHEANGQSAMFNSQQISDGVLRLLAVTSLLYVDHPPSVITFEEPENGVHPQLVREVVRVLQELTLRKAPHHCQVFFTTHSPYVLDEFFDHPEQVLLVERGKPREGATITKLSDRPQIKLVRDTFELSLGEAWVGGLIGAAASGKP